MPCIRFESMDTLPLTTPTAHTESHTGSRRLLMCEPRHFGVDYEINPWMHREQPVDTPLAQRQWAGLVATYQRLGHAVERIEPQPGLPDMVYAANGALVIDGIAWLARFRHPERRGEEPAFAAWFESRGFRIHPARHVQEGEGDFVLVGERLLAGFGFRTDRAAHEEARQLFGREVLSLELVDPRFYHLDMALFALDAERIAYFPGAFSAASQALLERTFPDALQASEAEALAFGLNAFSDGRHVVIAEEARSLADRLARAGLQPVPVALSELRRGGGGIKCCTLELRGAP